MEAGHRGWGYQGTGRKLIPYYRRTSRHVRGVFSCVHSKIARVVNTDYDRYIHSDAWKSKRIRRLKIDKNRCQGCRTSRNLHVHHRTYERFGGLERMNDLVTVCDSCHAIIHQLHQSLKSASSLDQVTGKVLRQLKAASEPHWTKTASPSRRQQGSRRQSIKRRDRKAAREDQRQAGGLPPLRKLPWEGGI